MVTHQLQVERRTAKAHRPKTDALPLDYATNLVGRSLVAKISGGRGRPWGILFGFYKTRHILLSKSANCTVLRVVVLTQYRRVTDGRTDRQTDGIAIANTALAMRELRAL